MLCQVTSFGCIRTCTVLLLGLGVSCDNIHGTNISIFLNSDFQHACSCNITSVTFAVVSSRSIYVLIPRLIYGPRQNLSIAVTGSCDVAHGTSILFNSDLHACSCNITSARSARSFSQSMCTHHNIPALQSHASI
jgi:hypothetical protein